MSAGRDPDDVMIDEALDELRESLALAVRFLAEELSPLIESSNDVAFLDLARHLELVEAVSGRLRQAGVTVGEDPNAPARRLLEVIHQALREEW